MNEKMKKVEVVLKKDHIHAGKTCKKGDKIKVRKSQVSWLRKQGVI